LRKLHHFGGENTMNIILHLVIKRILYCVHNVVSWVWQSYT
jgi:hypothetical protein